MYICIYVLRLRPRPLETGVLQIYIYMYIYSKKKYVYMYIHTDAATKALESDLFFFFSIAFFPPVVFALKSSSSSCGNLFSLFCTFLKRKFCFFFQTFLKKNQNFLFKAPPASGIPALQRPSQRSDFFFFLFISFFLPVESQHSSDLRRAVGELKVMDATRLTTMKSVLRLFFFLNFFFEK